MNTHSVAAMAYFSLLPGQIHIEHFCLSWHTMAYQHHQAFSLVRSESNPRARERMAPIDQCYQLGLSIPPATFQNYAGWFASKLYKIVKHCVPKLPSIAPNPSQSYHCLRPYQLINPRFQQAQSPPLPFTASRGTAALTVPDTRVPLGVTLLEGSRTVAMADQTTVA